VLAFKSEIVGTFHALEILALTGASPHSVVSAGEFIRQAQTNDGGFFLAPFFAEYLDGHAVFSLTYYGATSLHDKAYAPDSWLKMLAWLAFPARYYQHGLRGYPALWLGPAEHANGHELLGWITHVQTFDPQPWTIMLVAVMVFLAFILVSRGIGLFFEKLGLLVARSSRSRSIEKIVYGTAVQQSR